MKSRSIKAKGHKLEYLVRDKLIEKFNLTKDDIRANIGSETGEDINLSKKALEIIPLKFECKSRSRLAVYTFYEQAKGHPGDTLEPVVVVKMNRKKPLAIIDLDYFLNLIGNNKKSG